jgi:hypothetical protein
MKSRLTLISVGLAFATSLSAQLEFYIFEDFEFGVRSSQNVALVSGVDARFGVFDQQFTPSVVNLLEWSTRFVVAPNSAGFIDFSEPEWSLVFGLTSNAAPFTVNTQLVMWIGTSFEAGPDSDWVLLTDPSWRIKAHDPLSFGVSLGFTPQTTALFGSFDFETRSIMALAAIPEPSTYAMLLGLGVLAVVGYRRLRR